MGVIHASVHFTCYLYVVFFLFPILAKWVVINTFQATAHWNLNTGPYWPNVYQKIEIKIYVKYIDSGSRPISQSFFFYTKAISGRRDLPY